VNTPGIPTYTVLKDDEGYYLELTVDFIPDSEDYGTLAVYYTFAVDSALVSADDITSVLDYTGTAGTSQTLESGRAVYDELPIHIRIPYEGYYTIIAYTVLIAEDENEYDLDNSIEAQIIAGDPSTPTAAISIAHDVNTPPAVTETYSGAATLAAGSVMLRTQVFSGKTAQGAEIYSGLKDVDELDEVLSLDIPRGWYTVVATPVCVDESGTETEIETAASAQMTFLANCFAPVNDAGETFFYENTDRRYINICMYYPENEDMYPWIKSSSDYGTLVFVWEAVPASGSAGKKITGEAKYDEIVDLKPVLAGYTAEGIYDITMKVYFENEAGVRTLYEECESYQIDYHMTAPVNGIGTPTISVGFTDSNIPILTFDIDYEASEDDVGEMTGYYMIYVNDWDYVTSAAVTAEQLGQAITMSDLGHNGSVLKVMFWPVYVLSSGEEVDYSSLMVEAPLDLTTEGVYIAQ